MVGRPQARGRAVLWLIAHYDGKHRAESRPGLVAGEDEIGALVERGRLVPKVVRVNRRISRIVPDIDSAGPHVHVQGVEKRVVGHPIRCRRVEISHDDDGQWFVAECVDEFRGLCLPHGQHFRFEVGVDEAVGVPADGSVHRCEASWNLKREAASHRNGQFGRIVSRENIRYRDVAAGQDHVEIGEADVVKRQRVDARKHPNLDIGVLHHCGDPILESPRSERVEQDLQVIEQHVLRRTRTAAECVTL